MKKRSVAVTTWFLIRFSSDIRDRTEQTIPDKPVGENENKQRVCQRLYFLSGSGFQNKRREEWVPARVVNSLFQHQDDVMVRLIGSDEIDHPGVAAGHLQDGHLVGDLSTAVPTSTPLPDELCGEHFSRGLLHAALHHGELPPDEPKKRTTRRSFLTRTSADRTGNLEAAGFTCQMLHALTKNKSYQKYRELIKSRGIKDDKIQQQFTFKYEVYAKAFFRPV